MVQTALSQFPIQRVKEGSPNRSARCSLSCGRSSELPPELLRKEVIQPHLPVRLPCYDFTLLTRHTLGGSPLAVEIPTWSASNSDGVTGGVYKARERIHRDFADSRLLAIPTSCSRVADCNPNWDRLLGFAPLRSLASLCTGHCSMCVALGIRAMMT